MGAINTSRSNLKNTNRMSSGTEYGAEVAMEVVENNGQVTAKMVVTFTIGSKTERHEFRVEGGTETPAKK
jgi:hypothetical protein